MTYPGSMVARSLPPVPRGCLCDTRRSSHPPSLHSDTNRRGKIASLSSKKVSGTFFLFATSPCRSAPSHRLPLHRNKPWKQESGLRRRKRQRVWDSVGCRRRRAAPDQDIGAEIGTVSPNQGAAFGADVPEPLRRLDQLIKGPAAQERAYIPLNERVVGEIETQSEGFKRLNGADPGQAHSLVLVFQWKNGPGQFTRLRHSPVFTSFAAVRRGPLQKTKALANRGEHNMRLRETATDFLISSHDSRQPKGTSERRAVRETGKAERQLSPGVP